MTENSEATPAPATLIAPSSTAEDHGTDTTNRGIVLRVVLLIAFFVLANAWFLLQFGVKLGSVFIIELIVGVSAGVRKLLRGPDAKAVDRMIESAFYGLLSTPALVILYALLAAVTLTHSTIVISDAHAKTACILPGSATTCTGAPLLSDDKQATFFEWTTPAGKSYRARLGDSDELPLRLWPWIPAKRSKDSFSYSPSILVRVPYPHADIVDGQIQIRDRNTKAVLASATTTDRSAAMLLGREVTVPLTSKDWDDELIAARAREDSAKKAQARWRQYLRPDHSLKLADAELEAVFRTQKQLSSSNPDDVAASAPITVRGGEAMQDVKLERRKHE
jgi:hypothetical protein